MPVKATAKKTTATKAKKTVKTEKPAKVKATKVTVAKKPHSVKEAYTKSELYRTIAERVELTQKQVSGVFEELAEIIGAHMKAKTVGSFTLPGLLKCRVIRKPATKARKGVNPFTGEETTFKAKPARNVVKIRPLKKLKDMV